MAEFRWPVRVYHEDTDGTGMVYHANHLKFMERARTEWLRARGIEQDRLGGLRFVVASLEIAYLRPARFNDALEVSVAVAKRGRASLTFHQAVMRGETCLCRGRVKVACLGEDLRPRPLPRWLWESIDAT